MKGEFISIKTAEKLARIDKAIKYIKENSKRKHSTIYGLPDYTLFKGNIEEVLNILEGNNERKNN